MEKREIDLLELFGVIKKYLASLIIVAILGGAVAFAYTYFLVEPTYRTSTSMIVISDN